MNRSRTQSRMPRETALRWVLSLVFAAAVVWSIPAGAQVLGACGTPDQDEAVSPAGTSAQGTLLNGPVPMPGDRAMNFELPAVVGGDIKMFKLSDYDGKWRVVCFYPGDFTFV